MRSGVLHTYTFVSHITYVLSSTLPFNETKKRQKQNINTNTDTRATRKYIYIYISKQRKMTWGIGAVDGREFFHLLRRRGSEERGEVH
jgi:hypothetical protein